MPGCRMPGTSSSDDAAGASGTRMSASGTANDGQTRRGSQTSIARVLSTTVSPPRTPRTRRSIGS